MNTEPMIGSIRGFQPSTAAQANQMSTYESAASNWWRAREHLDRARIAAHEANEEHEKASAAESEAWSALQAEAGRGPQVPCAQDVGAQYIGPPHPAQRPR